MYRFGHVNRVQGEQKRIFGERHKCVCYFRVGIRCNSQCTSSPILRKEELVGLLHSVKLWKSGSKMHIWGPSCFYNYKIEIVWNILPEPKPTHTFLKYCFSRSHGRELTPEPCFDYHVSLGLNVSNIDQDRNLRSGQVWLLWTPISSLIMLWTNDENDVLRIVESLQLWWFWPYMDNGSSISNFHGHIARRSFQAF